MVARGLLAAVAALVVAGCQCGFDAGKLDDLACTRSSECRPDQDCIDDVCTQRPCTEVTECGPARAFDCLEGFCEARACDDERPCAEGHDCIDGLCTPPRPDAGPDSGVDAAVPCTSDAECDDRLSCTEDRCIDDLCSNQPTSDDCAIDGACWNAGDTQPDNPCRVCDPARDATHWTTDDTAVPNDGIDCTIDRCEGGQPINDPNDAACLGNICSACARGCIERPELVLDCPDVPGVAGGAPVTCTISSGPPQGASTDCVTCTPVVGMTSLARDTFDGCPPLADLGWQGDFQGVNCNVPSRLGPDTDRNEPQIILDDEDARLERWVDTTDFDSVRLCFDFARDESEEERPGGSVLHVELDTGGAWMEAWSSEELSGAVEAWTNVCLDLVSLDPLAAGNPVLGIRFVPGTGVGFSYDAVYLDNVAIDGWASRTLEWPGPVFTSDFAGCSTEGWTVDGVVSCPVPGMGDAAGADGELTLDRDLDLSGRCEGLRIGFSLLQVGADANERAEVYVEHGGPELLLWGVDRGPEPDSVVYPFEISLSHVDPPARFQPALSLSMVTEGSGFGDTMALDEVWVDGAECLASPDLVSATPAAQQEPGYWTIDVSGTARTTAYLQCSWEGRVDTIVTDTVQFCRDAQCAPGSTESQSCGECGSQSRRCDQACRWLDWSPCNDYPCSCCDPYGANCSSCCC